MVVVVVGGALVGGGGGLLIEVEVAFFEISVWLSHHDLLKNCHFKI